MMTPNAGNISNCLWDITVGAHGGWIIKNFQTSKYLTVYGYSLYAVSATLNPDSSSYNLYVWRAVTTSSYSSTSITTYSELNSGTVFHSCYLMTGWSDSIKYRKNPSNALWASGTDFLYSGYSTSIISIDSTGKVTPVGIGNTSVICRHKVTNLSFSLNVVVLPSSQNKGSLQYWANAEDNTIGHWNITPSIYKQKLNDDISFYFLSGVSDAKITWNGALGISAFETNQSTTADIIVYGGTRDELEELGYTFDSTTAGSTSSHSYYSGYYYYGTSVKLDFTLQNADICIIDDGQTANRCKNVCTHELGHALGFFGHASSPSAVMYPYTHDGYTLQTLEKTIWRKFTIKKRRHEIMKKIFLLVLIIFVISAFGCSSSNGNDNKTGTKSVSESIYSDITFTEQNLSSKYLTFEDIISTSTNIVKATYTGDVEKHGIYKDLLFTPVAQIKGKDLTGDFRVRVANQTVSVEGTDISFETLSTNYSVGETYVLLLEKHVSVYLPYDVFVSACNLFIPVGEQATIYDGQPLCEHSNIGNDDTGADQIIEYIEANMGNDISATVGNDYVRSNKLEDVINGTSLIIEAVPTECTNTVENNDTEHFACSVGNVLKGEYDGDNINVIFSKGNVEKGKKYIVLVNRLSTSDFYILSSKNSVHVFGSETADKIIGLINK